MATVADNDVEEASPAPVSNNDHLSGKSLEATAPEASGDSCESNPNNCTEMQTYASKAVAGKTFYTYSRSSCVFERIQLSNRYS